MFTCCHPALAVAAQVALTLRTVAGLDVADIASAFLVTESTMEQRLVRARRKIANAAIPYEVPPPERLEERLTGVLAVIYLTFNQGYSSASDDALASTAIALARQLVELMPNESEARGLLALLLLQHSRRDARRGRDGVLLTLEEQDRRRWRRRRSPRRAASSAPPAPGGRTCCRRRSPSATRRAVGPGRRWDRDRGPLRRAAGALPSPVVELNRAIAVGMRDGPVVGLAALDELGPRLADVPPAARRAGGPPRPSGRPEEAAAQYRAALELTDSRGARRRSSAAWR